MARSIYFPVLDVLRFVACLGVLVSHSIAFFKFPGVRLSFYPFLENAGYFSVVFFYTLSGFLITYLLLNEKENTGTIAVRNFYIRRALRIWPLYYVIIFLSFFVFPNLLKGHPVQGIGNWPIPFLLYLLMLPNLAIMGGYYISTCFHTYTIGYEEQFYLFWPLFIRKAGRGAGYIGVVLFLLPWGLDLARLHISALSGPPSLSVSGLGKGLLMFISFSNIPAFIAGAAAAWLYLNGGRKFRLVMSSRLSGAIIAGLVMSVMYFTEPQGPGYVNGVSLIFALLILHLVWSNYRGGWVGAMLVRGGRISYGIYIYHVAACITVLYGMMGLHLVFPDRPLLTYMIYLLLTLVLLLLLAGLSYRYFERYFLRKKRDFRPIQEN